MDFFVRSLRFVGAAGDDKIFRSKSLRLERPSILFRVKSSPSLSKFSIVAPVGSTLTLLPFLWLLLSDRTECSFELAMKNESLLNLLDGLRVIDGIDLGMVILLRLSGRSEESEGLSWFALFDFTGFKRLVCL